MVDYFKDYQEIFTNLKCRLPLNEIVSSAMPDISGNNHPATLVGSPTISKESGMLLNGSSQYASLVIHADFQVGSGDYYMSMWISPASVGTPQTIFWYGNDGNAYNCLQVGMTSVGYIYAVMYDSTVGETIYGPLPLLISNEWYFIEIYRISSVVYVKVNGVMGEPETGKTAGVPATNPVIVLGKEYGTTYGTQFFSGYIKDFIFVKGTSNISNYSGLFYNHGMYRNSGLMPIISGTRGVE